jgi:hypothetical protein
MGWGEWVCPYCYCACGVGSEDGDWRLEPDTDTETESKPFRRQMRMQFTAPATLISKKQKCKYQDKTRSILNLYTRGARAPTDNPLNFAFMQVRAFEPDA